MDKITIKGIDYSINECSDLYLEPIVEFYDALTTDKPELIDFELVNKVCQSFKEVLLSDLGDEVISINKRNRYLWNLDFNSLAIAVLDVMKIKVQAKLDNPDTYNQTLEAGVKFIDLFRASLLKDESAMETAKDALGHLLPNESQGDTDGRDLERGFQGEDEAIIRRQIEELQKKLPSVV